MVVSRKSDRFPSFIVMDVLDKAVEMQCRGIDVIHMEVGEPDFDTPEKIVDAGAAALRAGATHYTHSMGFLPLREAIAGHYKRKYGVDLSPDRILVTMGSSPAMLLSFCTLLDPGDEILVPDPGYPCYQNMVEYIDGIPCPVTVRVEDGFELRVEVMTQQLGPKTKGIIVNSPANPTGSVCSPQTLSAIADLGPYVLSDEIYHGMTYGAPDHTMLEYTDRCFVVSGFSKFWAMTGWRLGWVIAPEPFVRPMQKMQQNFFVSPADFSQHAAVAALEEDHPELEIMRRTYGERREFLLRRLPEIGLPLGYEPEGAFYLFLNVRDYTDDCFRFAFEILDQAHVAVTPGVDFGSAGEGYIRISYANSLENLTKAMNRLEAFLRDRKTRKP